LQQALQPFQMFCGAAFLAVVILWLWVFVPSAPIARGGVSMGKDGASPLTCPSVHQQARHRIAAKSAGDREDDVLASFCVNNA
jgi:hypothetical protein